MPYLTEGPGSDPGERSALHNRSSYRLTGFFGVSPGLEGIYRVKRADVVQAFAGALNDRKTRHRFIQYRLVR
jgi:hypothetical protein